MRFFIGFMVAILFADKAAAVDSYADLVEQLMPSVVNISTEKETVADTGAAVDNLMLNPALQGREALGSGFFVREDGYILTNNHVIKGAKKINVITEENEIYAAKVIGIDTPSDLAVLKIDVVAEDGKTLKEVKPVVFGNADAARIGDKVLVFGNPYGLGVSVSQGIISAKSRDIGLGGQQYLQTDAAINRGNSGGPMFSLDGEVIGVNAALFASQGASGIGFALPSNVANWVANQLIESGKVRRGWLGFSVANGLDSYTGKAGFVITEIDESSTAYKEGMRVGEIITAYNDIPATDVAAFLSFTETMQPGESLRLKALSYGEEFRTVIKIQDMPADKLQDFTAQALKNSYQRSLGSEDGEVYYISEFKIAVKEADPRGLAIIKIDKTSPLSGKGIKIGDIILEADRADIYTAENLLDSIRNAVVSGGQQPISLLIQGTDNIFYSSVEPVSEND